MSGALTPTVALTPTAVETTTAMLALMAAENGTLTDFNIGSNIRTLGDAAGAVMETQGVASQALALQSLYYGAVSLFGLGAITATAATGIATFATALPVSAAPAVPQAVPIPSGTLIQTNGGIQFATTTAVTLASGTSSVVAGIIATLAGSAGNVASGAITGTPLTSVTWPLYVTNTSPTAGGTDSGTPSNVQALFAAKAASLGLSSPVAVANASIGVSVAGTGETVQYAANFEPWIAAGSGAGSGVAGFTLYIDNGTGGASSSLISAVVSWLNGDASTGRSGYRPAGVPYTVIGVTPVYAVVTVSGLLYPGLLATGSISASVITGVQNYFSSVGISPAAAYQAQIAALAGDAGLGLFSSLIVNLFYSGSSTPVSVVSGASGTRVILAGLAVNIGAGG